MSELEAHLVPAGERLGGGGKYGSYRAHVLVETSRYYRCPHCEHRTKLNRDVMTPDGNWEVHSEEISEQARKAFWILSSRGPKFRFDFHCRGCERPVRLLFDYEERFQGGPRKIAVSWVIELTTGPESSHAG